MRLLLLLTLAAAFACTSARAADLRFSTMEHGDTIIARLSCDICFYDHSETFSHTLTFTRPGPNIIVSVLETSHIRPKNLGELVLSPTDVARLDKALQTCRAARDAKATPRYGESEISLTFVERGSIMLQESLHSITEAGQETLSLETLIARCEKENRSRPPGTP
jgi:hypothetical protein